MESVHISECIERTDEFDLIHGQFDFLPSTSMRIHLDRGASEAIEIAMSTGQRLVTAGIVQDREYLGREVAPHLESERVWFRGNAGPAVPPGRAEGGPERRHSRPQAVG